jgi:hypothetical protein
VGLEEIGPGANSGEVPAAVPARRGLPHGELDEILDVNPEERKAFLEYVAAHRDCSVRDACAVAGVRRRDMRALIRGDAEFAEDYATARGRGVEQIHAQMVKLAIEGVDEPLVSMGEIVGTKKVYSERLLQTMFNALTPEGRATLGNKIGLEINTGGGDVKLQEGVALEDVAAFMRDHVPGFRAQLEGEPAGEIVDVVDEPVD